MRRGRCGVTDGETSISRSTNLRREARALYKEVVWSFTRHRQGPRRNICLFATRRGGSTWLMETISANRGIRALDQPFSSATGTLTAGQFRAMPKFDGGMVIELDDEQAAQFRRYVDQVMNGALPVNAPTRFWARNFDFRSNRLLLKITDANSMIDWFDKTYDVDVLFLTRHPIPQALSCIRNGWTCNAGSFLRNPRFVGHHLGDDLAAYAGDVLATGSDLEKFVLDWTLENLVPIRLLEDRPHWSYVSYEQCVLEPEATMRDVAGALELADFEAMSRRQRRASRSSGFSTDATRARIAAGDRGSLVAWWRGHVGEAEERRVMALLERFGISLYRAGSLVPEPRARFATS
jgi:hypothetical protein